MAEELGLKIILEPDTTKLDEALKGIKNGTPIKMPVTVDTSGISSKNIAKKLGKVNVEVDIDDSAINAYKNKLKGLGFGDLAVGDATKALNDMGIQVKKVRSNIDETNASGQKLKSIIFDGVNAEGDAVRVTQQYNLSKKKQLETNISITHEYEKQIKAQKNVAEETAKWKTAQENALKDLVSKAKNQTKPLWQAYSGTFDGIVDNIRNALNQVGDSVTAETKNSVSTMMADAARALKEAQNRQYVATSLRTKDIETVKAIQGNTLSVFESKIKGAGMSSEMFTTVTALKENLAKAFDTNALTAWLNQLDVAKSKLDTLTAEAKARAAVERAAKKAQTDEERAAKKAQKEKSQQDILNSKKGTASTKLGSRIQELERAGQYTGRIKEDFDSLKLSLENVTNADELRTWAAELETVEAKVKQFQESTSALASQRADDIGSNQLNQIEKFQQQLNSFGDTDGFNGLRNQLDSLKTQYHEIINLLSNPDLPEVEYTALVERVKELDQQLKKTASTMSKFGSDDKSQQYIARMESNIAKLKENFAAMKENWSAAMDVPELKSQIDVFEQRLQGVDVSNVGEVQAAFQRLRSAIKSAGADCQSFGGKLSEIKQYALQLFSWQQISQTAKKFFTEVIENVKNLDSAMTELKKVTDLTGSGYDKFLSNAGSRAKVIGTSMSSYIEGVGDFAKLGYSVEDATALSEAANILYKVGDGFNSIGDSSDTIIASMKAYGIAASDVTSVIDKLNEVSNKTSITTSGLSEAITKSASALSASGLSFDKSLALIVAGNESTRDPSIVGNALKTLSLRVRGAETDLEALGEETDEYVKSTSKMRDEIKALTGVDIMIDDSTFKDLYDVMDELEEKFLALSDIDRANLMEILFGKQRANVGASILLNFDQAERALKTAQGAAGSAMTEHSRWMESIEASEAKATAAFEEFSSKIMSSDIVKFFYDAKAGVSEFFSSIIDSTGSAIPLITSLVAAFASLKSNIGVFNGSFEGDNFFSKFGIGGKSFAQRASDKRTSKANQRFAGLFDENISGMDNATAIEKALSSMGDASQYVSEELKKTAQNATGAISGITKVGTSSKAASIGMKALATVANMALAALATWAVTKVYEWIDSLVTAQERAVEAAQNAKDSLSGEETKLDDLNTQLEETRALMADLEGRDLTFVEEDEYNRLKRTNDELEREIKLQEARVKIAEKEARDAAVKAANTKKNATSTGGWIGQSYIDDQLVNLALQQENFDATKYGFANNRYLQEYPYASFQLKDFVALNADMLSALKEQYLTAQKDINDYIADNPGELTKEQLKKVAGLESQRDSALAAYDKSFKIVDDYAKFLDEQIGDLNQVKNPTTSAEVQFNGLWAERDKYEDALVATEDKSAQWVSDKVLNANKDAANKIEQTIKEKGKITVEELEQQYNDVVKAFQGYGWGSDDIARHLNELYAPSAPTAPTIPDTSTLITSLYKNTEAYATLNDAISEQASAGKISAATMQELLKINPDFISSLEETADGYKISTDALMDYIEVQDLLERTKAVEAIAALNEELNSPITAEHRNEILSQIQQLEMLVYEYDNATGALARYRAAQATENQDSMFQEGTAMYKMMKEALEIGKTGTDDFKAAMEFMLGEDWAQRFESVEAAQKQALKNAEKYFGQETESDNYVNFFDKLVGLGMASKENGQFLFDQKVSLEEIAEAAGMSLDAVRSLFGLAEAYGAEFDYDFEVDTDSLEYSKVLLDELAERKKNLEAALGQTAEGSQEYQTLQNEIELYERMISAGQAADGAIGGDIGSFDEMIERLATMKQYQSDLSGKGFDIPVQVSGDIAAINGLLSNFKTIKQDDGSIKYSVAIDENTTDEEIEGIKTALQNSLTNIASSTATQAVKDYATKVVNDAISAIDSSKSFEQTITSKTLEAPSGGVGETTGVASSLVAEIGVDVDQNQLNAVDEALDAVAEKERKANFVLPSPEDLLSTEEYEAYQTHKSSEQATSVLNESPFNNMSPAELDAYYSRPRSQREDGEHELVLIPKTTPDAGSQIVDEVQQQIDESGKSIEVDPKAEQYGLVQAIEDMFAAKSQSTTGFADGTSGYQDMPIAVDVPKQKLDVDVDAQLNSDVGSQIAEEAQEQIDQEQVVAEIGVDVDALGESAQKMISIAESSGVAQEKQENLKTATEALKAAFANLQATDPYDAEGLQAASSEFNNAVQNFQSAYNTLASDLQGIDPINVSANISSAQRSINSLNGKVVTITVQTTPVTATINGQTVGETHARGTTNARNGMSLVDEEGAELIEHVSEGTYELGTNKGPRFTRLNAGDIVHTASETKKILSRMGSSIGGFFRDGLNNAKAIIGGAFRAAETVDGAATTPKKKTSPLQNMLNKAKTNVSGSASVSPSKKPSSSSSSSSSNKGSGSSSSSKKDTKNLQDYLDKLFDWIEVRLTRLQEQTDGWIASAAEAVGYLAKNAQLDNAMNSVSKQIEANTKGYARYMQQANVIAEKFNIPDEVVKLVQEGDIDIASYDEDQQEKIKAYQEWYDKAVACKTAVTELREQERELAKEQLDNIVNHYQWRIDRYDNASSMSDANLEFKRATGQRVNINDYGDAVMANINKQATLKAERSKLSEELEEMVERGLIKKGSEEWFEYMSTLDDLDQTLVETKTALVEIQDAAQSIDLTELQWALAAIEHSAASIQNLMSLHEAQGIDHVADDYAKLIKNGMAQIANLEEQNRELLKMQEGLDVNSEKYQELQEQINANIDSIAGMKVNQEQWNDAILDLDIKKVQDYRDALTKQNTAYQNQLNLQQSLENLEKARSQRTQRVYREGMDNAPLYSNVY